LVDNIATSLAEVRRALAALPEGQSLEVVICTFSAVDESAYNGALDLLA
jgi:hypothetical protein